MYGFFPSFLYSQNNQSLFWLVYLNHSLYLVVWWGLTLVVCGVCVVCVWSVVLCSWMWPIVYTSLPARLSSPVTLVYRQSLHKTWDIVYTSHAFDVITIYSPLKQRHCRNETHASIFFGSTWLQERKIERKRNWLIGRKTSELLRWVVWSVRP